MAEQEDQGLYMGAIEQSKTGLYQIWYSFDGKTIRWLSAAYDTEEKVKHAVQHIRAADLWKLSPKEIEDWFAQFVQGKKPCAPASQEDEQVILQQINRTVSGDTDYPRDLSLLKNVYADIKTTNITLVEDIIYAVQHREVEEHLLFECIASYALLESMPKIPVSYLHRSALKLCEAMLIPASNTTSFQFPEQAMWWQPLSSLKFIEGSNIDVRALIFYRPYTEEALATLVGDEVKDPHLRSLEQKIFTQISKSEIDAEIFRLIKQRRFTYRIGMVIDDLGGTEEEQEGRFNLYITFCEYDAQKKVFFYPYDHAESCNWGCTSERLGEQQVLIMCEYCEKALAWWPRWITTMMYIMEGRFRRPTDVVDTEEKIEYIPLPLGKEKEKNKKGHPKNQSQSHKTSIIQYNATSFRPSHPKTRRGPLSENHQIFNQEQLTEALRDGVLEVDTSILIVDFTPVGQYKRILRNERYYPQGVPERKEDLREIIVAPTERKRQLVTLETWRKRQEAESHREKIITARDTQEGK